MVKLGELNTRMKDFYDIWLLSRQFEFAGATLVEAIRLTFARRGTAIPEVIVALTDAFFDAKQVQWSVFCKRLQGSHVPASFAEVVAAVKLFLGPVVSALSMGRPVPAKWTAPGPWA